MNTTARRAARGRAIAPRAVSSCAALLAGAGLLLLTGCAGNGSSSSSSSSSRGAVSAGGAAPAPAGVPAAAASSPPYGSSGAASTAGGQADAARLAPAGQSIVYTANLTVQVRSAMGAAARAARYVTGAGGYTAAEQAQAGTARQRARVSLTLKVPVAGYGAALGTLGALGRQTALRQQSSDVTAQVADVGSLVTSEQAEIAQLRALLSRAGTVSGLLQVQQQLGSDESQLESLEAQQRALDHETSYATISVLLLGPLPVAVAAHRTAPRRGFGTGLAAGWHGLARATDWVLTAAGAVLPFAAVAAALGGLGYAGWRWVGRRRRVEPAA
jgi:hypothetical protein